MTPRRRLIVLRHAKSSRPPEVPDHERPLAPRGRRDAPAAGRLLAASDWLPDLVLCSTARRARETWDLAAAELGSLPPVRYEPRLYHPPVAVLLKAVREVPQDVATLLLVGHNPSLQETVLTLAGDGVGGTLRRVRTAFPTSAIALLTWRGTWPALAPHQALLTDVAVPRGSRS